MKPMTPATKYLSAQLYERHAEKTLAELFRFSDF